MKHERLAEKRQAGEEVGNKQDSPPQANFSAQVASAVSEPTSAALKEESYEVFFKSSCRSSSDLKPRTGYPYS